MITEVIRIGNSKGIRIPAYILKECNIADKVEMDVRDGKVIIFPIEQPRKDWESKFKEMHKNEDDTILFDENLDSHLEDWKW